MESLREIRRSIQSTKATRQIMYTMKMVAAARIKKAQALIMSSRPFAVKMSVMLQSLRDELLTDAGDIEDRPVFRFFKPAAEAAPAGLLLITSDKGLCGGFNASVLRLALGWFARHKGRKTFVFVVGRKGRDFVYRLKNPDMAVAQEITGIFPKAGYVHAELLGRGIMEHYLKHGMGSVDVIYNEFGSVMSQKPTEAKLLPLAVSGSASGGQVREARHDFIFEPGKPDFLDRLIPRHIKAQLYRLLLESQAAELAARMNAMESASKNADELISGLTLTLNRTRQAAITRELSEIVAGAEALKT